MKKIETVSPEDREVITALDVGPDEALSLAPRLARNAIVKVTPILVFQSPNIVGNLTAMGLRVMWDFKTKDIPSQVQKSVRAYLREGIVYFTIHADGGAEMVAAAVAGRDEWLEDHPVPSELVPKVLAVTVLTSQGDEDLHELGIRRKPATQVARLTELAIGAGADGIVCSSQEASIVRRIAGPDASVVTPGISFPKDDSASDQKRTGTPQGAIEAGASALVVGRGIYQANDPAAAYRKFLDAAREVA